MHEAFVREPRADRPAAPPRRPGLTTVPELGQWALDLAGSPWVLLLVAAVVTLDGFLPPVPSESVVIALAALSATGGGPGVWVLGAVAAVGAFTGDQVAYSLGRRMPVHRLAPLRSARARRARAGAQAAFAQRGAALVIGARFVPVGRVAVNMTAGAVRYSRKRFTLFAAVAAVTWSAFSVAVGVGAGRLLADQHPLVGAAVGVVSGLGVGVAVDAVLRRWPRARRERARRALARRHGRTSTGEELHPDGVRPDEARPDDVGSREARPTRQAVR